MGADGNSSPRFVPGAIVDDKFILQSRIGVGAVGDVWSAVHRTTRGTVALKLVAPGSVSHEAAARFRFEASLSASLAHRNIVRVYDFFEESDGTLGLVMELLRGESARDRLLRTGLLAPTAAVSVATQILAALAHAHALGIVHRDIKPPNIFLATEPDGVITPKLVDFGIAKTAECSVHTMNGQVLGTPRYMSPEQIRSDVTLDGRSDIFSVGTVLYELITGRCPFAAGFATASLAAVLEAKVAPDPLIPAPLWRVLKTALAKNRSDRYASAEDFADALREANEMSNASLVRVLFRSQPPPPALTFDGAATLMPPTIDLAPEDHSSSVDVPSGRRGTWARRAVAAVVALSVVVLAVGTIRTVTTRRATTAQPVAAAAPPRRIEAPIALPPPPLADVIPPAATAPSAPAPEARAATETKPKAAVVDAKKPAAAAKVTPVTPVTAPRAPTPPSAPTGVAILKDPGF
jgi:serine/threonine-protein kinase